MPTLREKQFAMRLRQKARPGPLHAPGALDPIAEGRARLHLYELWAKYGDMPKVSRITARPLSWLNEWRDRGFPLS